MFKSKINGDFAEEFTTTKKFVKKLEKDMLRKSMSARIMWIFFASLTAATNIVILIISSIALKKVIDDYNIPTMNVSMKQIIPTALVASLSIVMFLLSIFISIYQGLMKSRVYFEATEDIQYLTIAYKTGELKISEDAFKDKIATIYKRAFKDKNSISFGKTIIAILTGGNNE